MNVLVVTSKVKEENLADAEAALGEFFQALEQARPDVRYASTKLSDSVTFIAYLEMEPGQEHPLRTWRCWRNSSHGRNRPPCST